MNRPQVAISADFLQAFARLPKTQQKRVREFTEKFRDNPLQNGINYEHIHDIRDDKVRTVRIDQTYRAIVVHPPAGDVYLLVWVDHHDEAMAWAKNKVFEVNPVLGNLQVYEVDTSKKAISAPPPSVNEDRVPKGRLFAGMPHDDLLLCGVPTPLLPAVRALRTEADLDDIAPHLPREASDALYMIAAGCTIEDALHEAGRSRAKPVEVVDTSSFATALEKPDSQQRFNLINSERQLQEMLSAPLEQWRIFLHPSQRTLVKMNAKGPVRVIGGPGTGKTVVALHRAHYLASEVFTREEDRILFTTFTKNLAKDIQRQLRSLCSEGVSKRIEVVNLHQWARNFLRGRKAKVEVAEKNWELWEQAFMGQTELQFPEAFYRDEWKAVVQQQGITDRDEYFRAKRTGRGTPLTRPQRTHVWEIMRSYRAVLEDSNLMEWADVIREAKLCLQRDGEQAHLPYRAVVADETQDLGLQELELLRAILPKGDNDLFLVGDAHQRIYGNPVRLSAAGIETRGRSKRLKLNYRTTKEVRDFAVKILEGIKVDDLDDGEDTLRGYRSLRSGVRPVIKVFKKPEEEKTFIRDTVAGWRESGRAEEICIVARTKRQIEQTYVPLLEREGIPHYVVEKDDDSTAPGVRLATMHRVKGLEFPRVILAGVDEEHMPLKLGEREAFDAVSAEEHERRERQLLFVAGTRARDELVVTGVGRGSSFLRW